MRNYILTLVLAILVVLTSVSLRNIFAVNVAGTSNGPTLVAIGPSPCPMPPRR